MQDAKDQARLENLGPIKMAVHPLYTDVFKSEARTSDEIRALINRPAHKKFCNKVKGSGITKLVLNLLSNGFLARYLQAALIQQFDLLDKHPSSEKLFRAHIDIGIEPTEILDFLDVFMGKGNRSPEEMRRGMLQVNDIIPLTPRSILELSPDERGPSGHPKFYQLIPAGALTHISARVRSWWCKTLQEVIKKPSSVTQPRKRLVRVTLNAPPPSGHQRIKPCRRFNPYSADKENQLLLRTALRPFDLQLIRDAAANRDTHPAHAIRTKIARENIYKLVVIENDGTTKRIKLVE
ncbi:hypothetical protein FB45DRAFT_1122046 [Roridomyces roridus]|uniref:DUF8205 domain-containing protein n=1 Tax=Roridomyces roridus TaxID=1738132 RepID=A0AAD7F9A0_9AGAR|nr:hypothetical protein FB45DRAFT_1122046 [Roridomyces roridus]